MTVNESEEVGTTDTDEEVDETEDTGSDSSQEQEAASGDDGLKKALAAERKLRRDEKRRADAAEQLLADKDRGPDEVAIEQAKREARTEGISVGNARVIRAEVKAALAGKVSNPVLALKLIDLSDIDVDDDGEVDSDAVSAAVAALLADAPELAIKRFQGGADQGAQGKEAKPLQLTREDLKNLSPAQIIQAEKDGRLNALKGIK